eukprot:29325-Eustigmatos_ZCMA.PRE.1
MSVEWRARPMRHGDAESCLRVFRELFLLVRGCVVHVQRTGFHGAPSSSSSSTGSKRVMRT